ncbi:MAG TPA: hypothetical protein VGG38_11995 [Acidimicrobiales bacterium]|jgi:hypothetical protein
MRPLRRISCVRLAVVTFGAGIVFSAAPASAEVIAGPTSFDGTCQINGNIGFGDDLGATEVFSGAGTCNGTVDGLPTGSHPVQVQINVEGLVAGLLTDPNLPAGSLGASLFPPTTPLVNLGTGSIFFTNACATGEICENLDFSVYDVLGQIVLQGDGGGFALGSVMPQQTLFSSQSVSLTTVDYLTGE